MQERHGSDDNGGTPPWIDRHSVTCAICGGLADERRTAELTARLPDERPALVADAPRRAIIIATAVNEFGEGEAHEECLDALEAHLIEHGARVAASFDIDERYHR
jgi:hypothetical protein